MRIIFFSDIHGIINNLKYIEKQVVSKKIDLLVCLGDLYHAGFLYNSDLVEDSQKVHDFLDKYKDKLLCMKGNCDSLLDIRSSSFPIYEGVSHINVDDIDIYLTHGDIYNYDREYEEEGVLIYGHEHRPYIRKKGKKIFINTGSISLPRNEIATYCIYDSGKFTIYDINSNEVDNIDIE